LKKVTVKDIARISGFSIGSVDRAIHNRPGINSVTREKILGLCEEQGFRINRFAQSLSRKSYRLVAVIPDKGDEFYHVVEQGLLQAAEELSDLNVSLKITKTKTLGYKEENLLLKQYLEEGYSGIAVCAGHMTRLNPMINKVVSAGIPVVTMATDAPDSKRTATVAVPPRKTGAVAGAYMGRFIHTPGTVCVLSGSNEVMDHRYKAEGFLNEIKRSWPHLTVGEVIETHEDPKRLAAAVETAWNRYPDLKGLYLVTYGGHFCGQKLEEMGIQDKVTFISTDIYRRLWPFLERGTVDMLVHQNPFRQGFQAVHLLFDSLTGKDPDLVRQRVFPEFIIRENLEFYTTPEHRED